MIDAEIKRLIEEAETKARQILTSNRRALDSLTELLLDKEVLEGDELRALLLAQGEASSNAMDAVSQ